MGGDLGQLAAQGFVPDLAQRFQRRAQRRERVLDFVGNIGGKALPSVDPVAQGQRHIGNGAGEQADLVVLAVQQEVGGNLAEVLIDDDKREELFSTQSVERILELLETSEEE